MNADGRLWCVSVYFNATGVSRTAENFLVFAEALRGSGANLLVVELSFDGRFRLPDDGRTIRLRSQSVMWQKERLISFAVSQLPPECQYVAWIDGDILFARPDWHVRAVEALQDVDLVQLFSRIHYLGRPAGEANAHDGLQSLYGRIQGAGEGLIAQRLRVGPEWAGLRGSAGLERALPGYCWAARREFFDEAGLYERAVIGAGDKLFAHTLVGLLRPEAPPITMSRPMADDFLTWARRFARRPWRFGCLPDDVLHLWHGRSTDRQYHDRHLILRDADFDPAADVRLVDGVFEWASEKPALHEAVRGYFAGRREDA